MKVSQFRTSLQAYGKIQDRAGNKEVAEALKKLSVAFKDWDHEDAGKLLARISNTQHLPKL